MGAAISKLGRFLGDEIGGAGGNVLSNIFTYWGNGVDVLLDVGSILSLGGLGVVRSGVNVIAGAEAASPIGFNTILSAAEGLANLIPDLERAGAGIYHGFKGIEHGVENMGWATERSINSWFDKDIKPYTPRGWKEAASEWGINMLKDIKGGFSGELPVADLTMAHMRRFTDAQIRSAGDVMGIDALQRIRDPHRKFADAATVKRNTLFHNVRITSQQLANAHSIWADSFSEERQRVEGQVSDELLKERKEIGEYEKRREMELKSNPTSRIVGPAYVTPQATLR